MSDTATLSKPTASDYYTTLGVGRAAKFVQIRKRYLALVQEVHPDRFADPHEKAQRAAQFKQVVEAWDVLSNPELRARYDNSLAGGTDFDPQSVPASGGDWDAIMAEMKRSGFADIKPSFDGEAGKMLKDTLINDKDFKEIVIHQVSGTVNDLTKLPLNCVRGVSSGGCTVYVTNFGVVGIVTGQSEIRHLNSTRTLTYTNVFRAMWSDTERMELELDPVGEKFSMRLFGPENKLSGLRFQCTGGVFPLMWIADLYDIDIAFKVKHSRVGFNEIVITLTTLLFAGLTGLATWAMVGTFIAKPNGGHAELTDVFKWGMYGLAGVTALLIPFHLIAEYVRAWKFRQLARECRSMRAVRKV
ncbi:MAG TPA: DnaJ domain-containing protein [Planctomycetota bacterium]|nr:DnaJ domain-containing protein [Planctomycetota bacterium]